MARRGAAALLKPETCRRLSERLEDGDGVGPTCFVDGPNEAWPVDPKGPCAQVVYKLGLKVIPRWVLWG